MNTISVLARKDLRMMLRSRLLIGVLVVYPLLIAGLLITLLYDTDPRATIALVNQDHDGGSLTVNGETFSLADYRKRAEANGNKILALTFDRAKEALEEGQVDGIIVVPNGFFGKLASGVASGQLDFYTGDTVLSEMIVQRIRGSIYQLNLDIASAYVAENSEYLSTLVEGGEIRVNDREYDVLGLRPAEQRLNGLRDEVTSQAARDSIDEIKEFAQDAQLGLRLADGALNAVSGPVRLNHVKTDGKSPQLTARGIAFSLAVSVAFICIVLVAALTAAERDEHVLGRILRSGVKPWHVVLSKVCVGVVLSMVFAAALFAVFGVLAPQAWARLPLLLASVALAAATFSGLGALIATATQETRTATLVGILVVIPMIPLALLHGHGTSELISSLLPFEPSEALFNAVMYDTSIGKPLAIGLATLGAMCAIFCISATRLLRRLA